MKAKDFYNGRIMKSQKQIIERIDKIADEDIFGFSIGVLVNYLTYKNAKKYLKEGAKKEEWKQSLPTKVLIIADMKEYMSFAPEKASDHRGISAGRSISKMTEWLWLLGDAELVNFAGDGKNYCNYGAPILSAICKKYSTEHPELQEQGFINMSKGLPCFDGCDEGCA